MKTFKDKHFGLYENKMVPLEQPMVEAEYQGDNVELNSPKRSSGPKKFVVYVKDPSTGNVKKVNFGNAKDVEGGDVKINDKERAKAFSDRHNCPAKKDKLSPGYWACNLPRYAKQLGLKGGGNYFW